MAITAIAARPLMVDDAHVLRLHTQQFGDLLAQEVRRLRGRMDGQGVIILVKPICRCIMSSVADVLELSRAVLGGKRGYATVIRIYMDESGTHDNSPIVTVSAYAARPKQWATFTKEWNAKKKPIKVFHATECQNLYGEFKDWTEDKCIELVKKLLPVIAKHIPIGILIGIDL